MRIGKIGRKALRGFVVLGVILGLTLVPAQTFAQGPVIDITFDKDGDGVFGIEGVGVDGPYCLTPLDLDVKIELTPADPIDNPPYTYHIWWNLRYRENEKTGGETWFPGNSDNSEMMKLFGDEWQHQGIDR